MTDKNILHMLTPLKHMSPFDANMALDVATMRCSPTRMTLEEVSGLVQDAMFSRPPKTGVRTGLFVGGKNAILALDMLSAAKKALMPPFGISLFADPAGSFHHRGGDGGLRGEDVARQEATQPEGACGRGLRRDRRGRVFSGVIAAMEGADVTLVGYDGVKRVSDAAKEIKARFQADVRVADGSDDGKKADILAQAEAAFCAGRAGVRILSAAQLAAAKRLLIVADVNAVPPAGVEGLDMMANGQELTPHGTLGIGPLAIGNIKYKTESGLFQR